MAKPSIEDRVAIEDLMVRYTTSLDAGDTEGVVGCFVEGCLLASPVVGRYEGLAGIRRFADELAQRARRHGGTFRHVVSNFRIEVEGERGTLRCYLLDFLTVGGNTELLSPGEYECELVKLGGEWRFLSRIVHMDHVFSLR